MANVARMLDSTGEPAGFAQGGAHPVPNKHRWRQLRRHKRDGPLPADWRRHLPCCVALGPFISPVKCNPSGFQWKGFQFTEKPRPMSFGQPYPEGAFLHANAVGFKHARHPVFFAVIGDIVHAKIEAAAFHGRPEWRMSATPASRQREAGTDGFPLEEGTKKSKKTSAMPEDRGTAASL
jgi:hypothetical protein